jgi:TolB-like protein
MAEDEKTKLRLEIAHVLFMDIVGYSKLAIDDQRAVIERLNDAVQSTEAFQEAEAAHRLAKIPTGDGMALVFYDSPESPVECAMEISRKLNTPDGPRLRMGIHSGPVSGVLDVSGRSNIAGEGINIAQRVMDCGDAGHILLSKRVADDLSQFKHWRPHLHDLGECEVKHGVRVGLVNLFTSEVGNSDRPSKLEGSPVAAPPAGKRATPLPWIVAVAVILLGICAAFLFWRSHPQPNTSGLAASTNDKSIAVLPFEYVSEDKANSYFATGVRDEILAKLSQITNLRVVSRSSADRFGSHPTDPANVAGQLNVVSLLQGSVQKVGEELLINVQLVDARRDSQLWAQSYRRAFQRIFDVEAEVATQVAEALNIKLGASEAERLDRPATENPHAHDLYLRARALNARSDEQSLLQSVALLKEAVAADAHYAPAWAELANDHLTLADAYRAPREVLAEMRDAALMAVKNDDLFSAGHVWLGAVSELYDRNYSFGKREIERAVALEPKSCAARRWLGWHIGRIERNYAAARAELRKAEALDPLHPWSFWFEERVAIAQGDFSGALELARRVIGIDPHFFYDIDPVAHAYMAAERWDDAVRRYQTLPPSTMTIPNYELAVCYAHAGQSDLARKILGELEALETRVYIDKFHLAAIYAALGEKDKAFAALDRAIEDRSARTSVLRFDPALKPLFDDPRFARAEEKIKSSSILIAEQTLAQWQRDSK